MTRDAANDRVVEFYKTRANKNNHIFIFLVGVGKYDYRTIHDLSFPAMRNDPDGATCGNADTDFACVPSVGLDHVLQNIMLHISHLRRNRGGAARSAISREDASEAYRRVPMDSAGDLVSAMLWMMRWCLKSGCGLDGGVDWISGLAIGGLCA